jgi:hypothetical protein
MRLVETGLDLEELFQVGAYLAKVLGHGIEALILIVDAARQVRIDIVDVAAEVGIGLVDATVRCR